MVDIPSLERIEMSNPGRVLLFTGDGKGKTTAALGMAMRAVGNGMKVKIIQFIKANNTTGEIASIRMLPGAEIVQTGCGFVPSESNPIFAKHRCAAADGQKIALEAMKSGEYKMVVLDEICVAVAKGLLGEQEVINAVRNAFSDTIIVLTGRGATSGLIDIADTVTEMRNIKHGMQRGWKARNGVEM